jgi:hypothetical protein
MFVSLVLLILSGLQGYMQFKIYNATHIQFAFITIITYMFSESWIMFYFIGSGKTIKQTILEYKFDKSIYQKVIDQKRLLFPHLTFNILFVGTVFVIGGGVHTRVISPALHSNLYIFSLVHYIYLLKIKHSCFIETAEILSDLGDMIEKDN